MLAVPIVRIFLKRERLDPPLMISALRLPPTGGPPRACSAINPTRPKTISLSSPIPLPFPFPSPPLLSSLFPIIHSPPPLVVIAIVDRLHPHLSLHHSYHSSSPPRHSNPTVNSAMSVSPTPVNASPKQSSNTTSSTVPQSQSPTMPSITSSKLQSSSSSNIANASRSQLATMLTNALHEADSYRQQFEFAQQRASKFERIVNTLGLTSDSNGSLSINGQSTSRNREDDIKSHLLDAENRVERAERYVIRPPLHSF